MPQKAILWKPNTSAWTLIPLPQGQRNRSASHDLNDDAVVVGEYVDSTDGIRAFMWREGAGVMTLTPLTGGTNAGARAITNTAADGSVMVAGWSDSAGGRRAVLWRLSAP